ncbi:hypothetical protein LOF13_01740 [Klebsiella pneumoniae subsp. pneumoniae]|nr:hypothetical protein LOF13_01740 [Klebsiella pneumoniae subsp. pneumoniae]
MPEVNIITAVSSRLTGTGGRVSGSGRQSACHSLSETARASGCFQPVLHGRIEQDNPGAIWPTSASLSACLSLVLKGTTSMPKPSAAKGLRKSGVIAPGQQNTVAFAQRPAAIKLRHRPLYPQMKIAVQIAPILKRQRQGIRAAGGAAAQGLVQILEVGGGAVHVSLLISRIE